MPGPPPVLTLSLLHSSWDTLMLSLSLVLYIKKIKTLEIADQDKLFEETDAWLKKKKKKPFYRYLEKTRL